MYKKNTCFSGALLIIIHFLAISTSLQAVNRPMERWFKATKSAKWTFEIKNKSKNILQIVLKDNDNNLVLQTNVGRAKGSNEKDQGYLRAADIDPTKTYSLFIELQSPTGQELKNVKDNRQVYMIFNDPDRKSIYLSFEYKSGQYQLRPQQGVGLVSKTTQSGLPLAKNITDKQIRKRPIELLSNDSIAKIRQ